MSIKFIPNLVLDSIYDIDVKLLKENNIKAILIDLDGTMESSKIANGDEKLGEWFTKLRNEGIYIFVMSNNKEERVRIFCDPYKLPYLSRAKKPFQAGYKQIFSKLKYKPEEVAMVGDQIFTDVFGGNSHGMFTIFVHSIDKQRKFNRFRNIFEKPFINKCKGNK